METFTIILLSIVSLYFAISMYNMWQNRGTFWHLVDSQVKGIIKSTGKTHLIKNYEKKYYEKDKGKD